MAANTQRDFATAPGETLADTLDTLGMTQTELAERTGLSKKTINLIIKGNEPLTHTTALALEKVLRIPARFWLNLENQYREHLSRVQEHQQLAAYAEWARTFPYAEMAKKGFVTAARKAEEKALILLTYFGVSTPEQWQSCYGEMELELSYRRANRESEKFHALTAWLRKGELLANETNAAEFDPVAFETALKKIRSFTTLNDPKVFIPQMQRLCADAGVVYHLIPELTGLGVSGVMRWFHKRPMIQQSLLFKTNDHFWFTFFHEAKHVLQNRKKSIFLEGDKAEHEDQQREHEANQFASNLMLPTADWKAFVAAASFSVSNIQRFAKSQNIHPGIIAGRLLHDQKIDYYQPAAKLRSKFKWATG